MSRNVEIKASVAGFEAIHAALDRVGASPPVLFDQEDTYFPCRQGRLKVRKLGPSEGELIAYVRSDDEGPKVSRYLRFPTTTPDDLRDILAAALTATVRVSKVRTLRLVGRTRVHLDKVEGLGRFLELEVVLRAGESVEAGMEEARSLMAALGIPEGSLIRDSYADLVEKNR